MIEEKLMAALRPTSQKHCKTHKTGFNSSKAFIGLILESRKKMFKLKYSTGTVKWQNGVEHFLRAAKSDQLTGARLMKAAAAAAASSSMVRLFSAAISGRQRMMRLASAKIVSSAPRKKG